MTPPDKSRKNNSEDTFVLVDTEHPGIGNVDLPETEVRRLDKPIPGSRQSADQGSRQSGDHASRQGGEPPGTEGGAPGPEASSGV
ncbi:hypothetical protein IP92_02661 [Pseudoduganella flava]|uniref:Uncharacterized protein n=1 Tax=Pseudoduganella flava TaxID=871742 RepID=A0A562PT38_9BURK|nr:hypothetical protein [Pseudoduganella flava]QGZ39115.1 hypothetical protein GO485_08700 [Pseudoduganella flava]TWI47601.1 hypothetical protein IP92_02661 [Pseudoduganella flava]